MAKSRLSIWKTIFNKFAAHGTLINLLSPFSSRFNFVLTILNQEALLSGTRSNFFANGHFMSARRNWNEKPNIDKTRAQFKTHFAAAHRQHKQMQG
jgi:hypothetical protein